MNEGDSFPFRYWCSIQAKGADRYGHAIPGTGIRRIYEACRDPGVGEPSIEVSPDWLTVNFLHPGTARTHQVAQHDAPHVTQQVERLLAALQREAGRADLMQALDLKDRPYFYRAYLQPALEGGLVEMTLQGRPRSPAQQYRLTTLGEQLRHESLKGDDG